MNENKSEKKEYRIYKPNQNGSGSASSWQISIDNSQKYKKVNVFLDMANQKPSENENSAFDWEGKVTVKLDLPDIGAILSVLYGRQDGVGKLKDGKRSGLYHKNSKGNAIIHFNENVQGDNLVGFSLRISKQIENDKKAVNSSITVDESHILRLFLEEAVKLMF